MADDQPQQPPAEPEGFSEEERAIFEKLNIGKEGGMPMPSFIRPSDVRAKTAGLAANIFTAWHALQAIVARHEPTLQRRWAGIKQKKKRRELLVAAAKDVTFEDGSSWVIPESHRPDIELWRDVREAGSEEKLFAANDPARRAVFLWPHLNLEDLSRAEPLVLMLSARARNTPDAFAAPDLERARFAMESLALMPHYLNRYTMMFDKRVDPATYGELVSWEELPDDSDKKWLFERRGIHPGEGLWLLEVQDVTYRFLVAVCKKILHDVPEDELKADGEVALDKAAAQSTTAAEYSSLITKIIEEPYRDPANLDRSQILQPVQARLQEAKDHLLALREDPAYFAAQLNDWATHRREQLVDAQGKPHPILAKAPQVFWSRVVNRVVNSALLEVVEWGIVLSKVKALLGLLDSLGPSLDGNKDLPAELAFAFYALDHHAEQLKAGPFGNITMGLVASPPMRPYFHLVTPEGAEDKTLSITAVDEAPAEESTRLLIRRLGVVQDEKQRQLVGLPSALDELEHLLTTQHPEARAKMTGWVASQLASLAIYGRLLRQVELFQPWAARFGADVQDKAVRDALDADFKRSVTAAGVPRVTAYEVSERLVALATPEKGRFDYPLDGPVGSATAEQIKKAELNLDGFWGRVRNELDRSGAMTGPLKEVFGRPLRRFGGMATVAAANATANGKNGTKGKTNGTAAAGEQLEDWEIYAAEMAAKDEKQAAIGSDRPNGHKSASAAKVKVDKRELKVFNTLFHEPFGAKQGEVAWVEFVHAMRAAGFTVTKLYGSAWLFEPSEEVGGAPMLVHEPFTASNKISPTMARVIGRRLGWNYGWDKETFS